MSRADEPRRLYLPPWRIDLTVRPGVAPLLPLARLARAAAAALDAAGAPRPASLGLILADDAELAALDREFMGVDGPTDVLSFPLLPPAAFPPHEGAGTVRGARAASGRPPDAAGGRPAPPELPPAVLGHPPAASELPPGAFALPPGARPHLGDIVVSVERAVAQALEGRGGQTGDVRWSARQELLLLVTHGTLHVCGWDHAEPVEEAAMRALERRLLGGA